MKTQSKGVYKLNPTKMIFKQGSAEAKRATSEDVPGFRRVKQVKPVKAKRKQK